jgi:hypothetical protein
LLAGICVVLVVAMLVALGAVVHVLP